MPNTLCDACHATWAWAEVMLPSGRSLYLCRHHLHKSFGDHVDPGTDFTIFYTSEAVG